MWQLALRNVFRQRTRTALTLAAIASGVAGLILIGGFVEDIFVQLRERTIHSQLGHIQVFRSGYLTEGRLAPHKHMIDAPDRLAAALASREDVELVLARLHFAGLLSNGRSDFPVVGEGVEPDKEAKLGAFATFVAGRPLSDRDRYGAVLGRGLAQALNLQPGDPVVLLVSTPEGALNSLDLEVVGVFQTISRDYDARVIRIPLRAARDLLGTRGAHSLVLLLRQTRATDRVAQAIARDHAGAGIEVKTWEELADFYRKTVDLYQGLFMVMQLVALGLVVLCVVNGINMAIFERTREFGTIRALGNRAAYVFRLILAESVVLGAFGSLAGVALGVALAALISTTGIPMPPPPNSDLGYLAYIRVTPAVVAEALIVGLVGTVLAAILPARRATRVAIAEALRHA